MQALRRTRSLRLENFHILAGAHESMEHEKLHKCAENVAKLHDLGRKRGLKGGGCSMAATEKKGLKGPGQRSTGT